MVWGIVRRAGVWGAALGGIGMALAAQPAAAQNQPLYELVAPPTTEWNSLYRLNSLNGEVRLCWYETGTGNGITRCVPAGEGAGPGANGKYELVPSNLAGERGVFRINRQTGEVSVCFLQGTDVGSWRTVCTTPAK